MTTDPLDPVLRALSLGGGASSDFDLNPGTVLPEGRKLRPAGVLVPLILREGRVEVILTKRSSQLKHHPGQVAFPGGKVDPTDADATAAALREAHEEIGLDPTNVEVLGELPWHETVTSFTMTPIVGVVRQAFTIIPEPGEVEEVFQVPLSHVTNPANFSIQSRQWLGRERRYFTVPFGPYYIWGATARILRGMAERMAS